MRILFAVGISKFVCGLQIRTIVNGLMRTVGLLR